jgi:hypothetical protein
MNRTAKPLESAAECVGRLDARKRFVQRLPRSETEEVVLNSRTVLRLGRIAGEVGSILSTWPACRRGAAIPMTSAGVLSAS